MCGEGTDNGTKLFIKYYDLWMRSEIFSISFSKREIFFIIYSFVKQMKSGIAHFAMLHGRYGYDLRDSQVQSL